MPTCLFYTIFLNIASRYLMKPSREFLTDLLTNHAIIKKMFLGWNILPHRKIETKEFPFETLLIHSCNGI